MVIKMNHLLSFLTTEPHDEHHFGGDFMISEEVEQKGEGEDNSQPDRQEPEPVQEKPNDWVWYTL